MVYKEAQLLLSSSSSQGPTNAAVPCLCLNPARNSSLRLDDSSRKKDPLGVVTRDIALSSTVPMVSSPIGRERSLSSPGPKLSQKIDMVASGSSSEDVKIDDQVNRMSDDDLEANVYFHDAFLISNPKLWSHISWKTPIAYTRVHGRSRF